jgi:hypothetical protein
MTCTICENQLEIQSNEIEFNEENCGNRNASLLEYSKTEIAVCSTCCMVHSVEAMD